MIAWNLVQNRSFSPAGALGCFSRLCGPLLWRTGGDELHNDVFTWASGSAGPSARCVQLFSVGQWRDITHRTCYALASADVLIIKISNRPLSTHIISL